MKDNQKKHLNFLGRAVAFIIILALLMVGYFKFITPEYYTDEWPITSVYEPFYSLEKDTADVLFFGSSHGVSGFMPQVLYDDYGITAYNLSCEQQSMVTTYYWLREALKYQKPKVVCLETFMLYLFNQAEPLNTAEVNTRKSLDGMRWGRNKISAVRDICSRDEKQNVYSYVFPNIRYHDRWEYLDKNEYLHDEMMSFAGLCGSWAIDHGCDTQFAGYDMAAVTCESEMLPLMQEYLERITVLCEANDIELILVQNPTIERSPEDMKRIDSFASEHGLRFINFNDKNTYRDLNFVFTDDSADNGHPNFFGAVKITDYIGKYISNEINIAPHKNPQWDRTHDYYEDKYLECLLERTDSIEEALDCAKSKNLSVMLAVGYDGLSSLKQSERDRIEKLGITEDLSGNSGESFAAVIDKGKVIYQKTDREPVDSGNEVYIQNGNMSVTVQSGDVASVILNGARIRTDSPGLNIVIFCNESSSVLYSSSK